MKVVLIRHPKPLIEPGICYGRLDVPLHPQASADVKRLAEHSDLRGIRHVFSSPAKRCLSVANAISASTAAIVTIDPGLQELDFGTWEGRPWNSIDKADLDAWAAAPLSFAPPGGESGTDIVFRLQSFYLALRAHQTDCVVVSHGGPLKVLAALLANRPVDLLASAPPLGSLSTMTVV